MKNLFIYATLAFALAACRNEIKNDAKNSNQNDIEQTTEKSAIEKFLFSYRDALLTSDVNKVMSHYTNDGVFMANNAPSTIGQEQIKGSYEFLFKTIQFSHIEFVIDEIVVNGDFAILRTHSKFNTLIHANGRTVSDEGRELFVLQKTKGQWKISRYMFNAMK